MHGEARFCRSAFGTEAKQESRNVASTSSIMHFGVKQVLKRRTDDCVEDCVVNHFGMWGGRREADVLAALWGGGSEEKENVDMFVIG